jgi:prepilin-type N-terminal cleavage/methylation domain-containing protein
MTRPTAPHHAPPARRRGGFTLLELMISIALVLILILGVNTVFSLTSQTVGAGNALGGMYRHNMAFHGVIYQDFKMMSLSDSPCFVIQNQRRSAFRNRADLDSDKDYSPTASAAARDLAMRTVDRDGDGTESTAETTPLFVFDHRNHRIDKMMFFVRGKFYRQTGTGANFWDNDPADPGRPPSSPEAWVRYGFLRLPNNTLTQYPQPADTSTTGTPPLNTPEGNPNNFFATQWILGRQLIVLTPNLPTGVDAYQPVSGASPTADSSDWLMPLAFDSQSTSGGMLQDTRYDAAQATMSFYRDRVRDSNPGQTRWRYWHVLGDFYYRGNHLLTRPLTSDSVARALPSFVPGCSQFMVEYAGDFLRQNPDGTIVNGSITPAAATPTQPLVFESEQDGTVDFVVGPDGVKRTRWYGLTRDTNADGVINPNVDVVPLKDAANFQNRAAPWERTIPSPADGRYIVAWGADPETSSQPRPTMLRITITVDDPDSRVGGGESFEYVGTLK